MKKIGVISDVHGNLQALTVALNYLKQQNCQEIVHTGDVLSIGANSRECVQLLLQNNVVCLIGNHDLDFLQNNCKHKLFSHVSTQHKQFVFQSVEEFRTQISTFPLFAERICGGKKVMFEHYCREEKPLPNGYIFKPLTSQHPTAEGFDEMYQNYDCDVVFFGHKHEPCDKVGKKTYVDVGSVGCHPEPLACGIVITFDDTHFSYSRFALPYDQKETRLAMEMIPDGKYLFDFYYLHKDTPRTWEE